MGARLRRHNELLMQDFVRSTLQKMKAELSECSIVFLGTTKLNVYLFLRCIIYIICSPLFFEEDGLDKSKE